MRKVMENTDNLTLKQAEVAEILWEYDEEDKESQSLEEKRKKHDSFSGNKGFGRH